MYWGVDLQSEHERYITEEVYKKPVFLTDYPKEIKAFYMRLNDDGKTVAASDLLVPGIGELVGGNGSLEFLGCHEVVIHAVLLSTTNGAGSGRNGERQAQRLVLDDFVDDGRFVTTRRRRSDYQFSCFHGFDVVNEVYNTLSTCSLICSNWSFIATTTFCISAWLALEPVVLISRPISWAINPSFLPCPGSACNVSRK